MLISELETQVGGPESWRVHSRLKILRFLYRMYGDLELSLSRRDTRDYFPRYTTSGPAMPDSEKKRIRAILSSIAKANERTPE